MGKFTLALVCYFLVLGGGTLAQDVELLQRQGVEARKAGRLSEALERLREAERLKPEDADIQLQLGLTLTPLKKWNEAERALRRTLELAPNYLDAKLGLARIIFFRGNFERAQRMAAEVTTARKDDKDARDLLGQINRAIAGRRKERRDAQRRLSSRTSTVPTPSGSSAFPSVLPNSKRWRLDLDGSWSRLTGGRQDWGEGNARLGYQAWPGTVLSAAVQSASRFGISDTYLEGRVDHNTSRGLTGYLYAGATPSAHYLPEWAVGSGATARLYQQKGLLAATVLTIDARYASYVSGPVRTVSPGIQQYLFDGRVWLTARWINVLDETGSYGQGYFVRGDVMLRNDLRAFLGYSDAPETSTGVTTPTRTAFGGLVYDFNESLAVRFSAEFEHRPQIFDRTTYTMGLTYKF